MGEHEREGINAVLEPEGVRIGPYLARLYTRWLTAYLIVVVLLWVLGVESIYGHPTPFYALYKPAFSSYLVPASALAAMALVFFLLRWWKSLGGTPWRRRHVFAFSCWLFVLALIVYGLHQEAAKEGRPLFAQAGLLWESLRRHLLALGLFSALAVSWGAAARFILPIEGEPARRAAWWAVAGLIAFSVLFSSSVAMIRGGPEALSHAYERHRYEYIGDIGKGVTIRGLFHDYNKMHPHLSMHSKVHPPGPVALLWLLSYVALGQEPLRLSIATILAGSLSLIPLYLWARDLAGGRVALICCCLYSLMPSVVLFTATSADVLFMPFTLTTLFLFWRALHRNSVAYAVAAGIGYAVLSLLSFSLLGLGAFFVLVGLWRLGQKGLRVTVLKTALVMAVAFLAFHGLVRVWSGFDIVECFRLGKNQFELDQFQLDEVTPRYSLWTFKALNPLCWAFFAGIPVTILCVWRVARPPSGTKALFLVFALTVLALDMLYLGRGEGERSALYVFPFLALPAAHQLDALVRHTRSYAPVVVTLAFLAFQCWLVESFLYTYW